ncbi:MAG: ArsR family transcriptional regulator, arsenate/arsenite/antimonite-responsive transcriptional [Actinomycetota bacterium]|nr:ArsR family transcriptional regulator, arsenate/arsenite/antimonite-responsive transcriptional [Actinomycetota bacterium]
MYVGTLGSMNVDTRASAKGFAELAVVECCSPLRAPEMSEEEAAATARLFRALGDPHRVQIVNLLANTREPVCVCDITATIGLSQPTTSFHLKKLVDSGLLEREQRGTWAYYSLDRTAFQTLGNVVTRRSVSK